MNTFQDTQAGSQEHLTPVEWRGNSYNFRPVSYPMLQISQPLVERLASIASRIFDKNDDADLTGFKEEVIQRDGAESRTSERSPIAVETYELKLQERREAFREVSKLISDPSISPILLQLLLDACPELEPGSIDDKGKLVQSKVGEFGSKLRLPDMLALCFGLLRANLESLGAEGKQIVDQLKERAKGLTGLESTKSGNK